MNLSMCVPVERSAQISTPAERTRKPGASTGRRKGLRPMKARTSKASSTGMHTAIEEEHGRSREERATGEQVQEQHGQGGQRADAGGLGHHVDGKDAQRRPGILPPR